MSFTSPKTYAVSDFLTASDLNTYQRDNVRWLSHHATGGAPMCRITHTVAQTITNNTATAVAFDTDRFDLGAMHDTATNNSRVTVPTGGDGKYLIGTQINWDSNTAGYRHARLRANGSLNLGSDLRDPVQSAVGTNMMFVTLHDAVATDYFETIVNQTSGGNLDVLKSARESPEMWALWLGE